MAKGNSTAPKGKKAVATVETVAKAPFNPFKYASVHGLIETNYGVTTITFADEAKFEVKAYLKDGIPAVGIFPIVETFAEKLARAQKLNK